MNPRSPFVASLLVISLCFSGCFAPAIHRPDEVGAIYERTSIISHGTGGRWLEVRGRTFRNLYSASYARVSEWNAIVFVTHRDGGSYKFHCFDLARQKDLVVKIDDALGLSGSQLGGPKTNLMTCYVDSIRGDTLVLVERLFQAPERRYLFDRQTKQITRQ